MLQYSINLSTEYNLNWTLSDVNAADPKSVTTVNVMGPLASCQTSLPIVTNVPRVVICVWRACCEPACDLVLLRSNSMVCNMLVN